MEGDVEDALVELLPVRRDLLHARLGLQVPQPDAAVVAWKEEKKKRDIVVEACGA